MFPYFETRTFRWKTVRGAPVFSVQTIFDTKNFVKHRRLLLRKCFCTVRQKSSERKSWYSSRLSSVNVFHTTKFLKLGRVLLRNVSVLWSAGNFRPRISIGARFLIPNNFRYENITETKKGSTTKRFGTGRQNNFDGKPW